jgi:hypothetical protein
VATPMALKRMQALQDKWVDKWNVFERIEIVTSLLCFNPSSAALLNQGISIHQIVISLVVELNKVFITLSG